MGFFSSLFKESTKADYDRMIIDANEQLARLQSRLESSKAVYGKTQPAVIAAIKSDIAHQKAYIANLKIKRKSAPK